MSRIAHIATPQSTRCQERGIGELYVDGDGACERGDLRALVQIAEHVVEHIAEPLHCALVPLAMLCADRERATGAWTELKTLLQAPR